jgi:hypothetical protein
MELVSSDELKRSLNNRFLAPPRRRERRTFRPAPQTRAVSRQFRRRRVREELDVFAFRSCRTNRTAVYARGLCRNEEFTVEAVVSGEQGLVKIVHRQ